MASPLTKKYVSFLERLRDCCREKISVNVPNSDLASESRGDSAVLWRWQRILAVNAEIGKGCEIPGDCHGIPDTLTFEPNCCNTAFEI
jgi:hypothetical protein